MAIKVTKADVWSGEIEDRAGSLDKVLGVLAQAGVDLQCVIARRAGAKAGFAHVYLTPVKGKKAEAAALAVGLMPAGKLATLRVEVPNGVGTGHAIMGAIALAGVSVRGISTVVAGKTSVAYVGFVTADDAAKAMAAIKKVRLKPAAKKAGAKKKVGKKR